MKKIYQKPEIDLVSLVAEEVIATGDIIIDGETGTEITTSDIVWQ